MTVQRLAVKPGDVLHSMGVRFLVLNARIRDDRVCDTRQILTVAALSHTDTVGVLVPWSMGLSVSLARTQDATVEAPEPDARRWWIAAALDNAGRWDGANGYREGTDCQHCAEKHPGPAHRTYVPCIGAQAHAWDEVGRWEAARHRDGASCGYYVLPVLADTWEDARAQAHDLCERLRTVGHL
ncbi:hypothetical protein ACGFZB_38300 [Streptomyces cinerochromogenes]|uniref:Uncharacterized protein n=1 Tax=Streptomyces cinerochromogenes TaxID=66422 RepID=A0ABW7BHF7_9ACTN